MPLVLLASGLGTFVLIGIAGLSVIERYLIVAALALLVFAAVARRRLHDAAAGARLRTAWMVAVGAARALRRRLHRHARQPHAARATSCSSAATRTTSLVDRAARAGGARARCAAGR